MNRLLRTGRLWVGLAALAWGLSSTSAWAGNGSSGGGSHGGSSGGYRSHRLFGGGSSGGYYSRGSNGGSSGGYRSSPSDMNGTVPNGTVPGSGTVPGTGAEGQPIDAQTNA